MLESVPVHLCCPDEFCRLHCGFHPLCALSIYLGPSWLLVLSFVRFVIGFSLDLSLQLELGKKIKHKVAMSLDSGQVCGESTLLKSCASLAADIFHIGVCCQSSPLSNVFDASGPSLGQCGLVGLATVGQLVACMADSIPEMLTEHPLSGMFTLDSQPHLF